MLGRAEARHRLGKGPFHGSAMAARGPETEDGKLGIGVVAGAHTGVAANRHNDASLLQTRKEMLNFLGPPRLVFAGARGGTGRKPFDFQFDSLSQ